MLDAFDIEQLTKLAKALTERRVQITTEDGKRYFAPSILGDNLDILIEHYKEAQGCR